MMLLRGLLSNVVMFDPQALGGSGGFVICSGHGPLFSGASGMRMAMPGALSDSTSDAMPATARSASGPTESMSMLMASPPAQDSPAARKASPRAAPVSGSGDIAAAGSPGPHDDASTQGGESVCPFSAALFAALVTLVVFLLTRVAAARRTRFRQGRVARRATAAPYVLALSRAPPLVFGR